MHTHGEETQVCNVIVMYVRKCSILNVFVIFFASNKYTVSGDANFVMSSTQLTVGGFTQPGVARGLIESQIMQKRDFQISSCGYFLIHFLGIFQV